MVALEQGTETQAAKIAAAKAAKKAAQKLGLNAAQTKQLAQAASHEIGSQTAAEAAEIGANDVGFLSKIAKKAKKTAKKLGKALKKGVKVVGPALGAGALPAGVFTGGGPTGIIDGSLDSINKSGGFGDALSKLFGGSQTAGNIGNVAQEAASLWQQFTGGAGGSGNEVGGNPAELPTTDLGEVGPDNSVGGISTKTLLLIGGAGVLLLLLMRRK